MNKGMRLKTSGWDLRDVRMIQKIGKSHRPVATMATTYIRIRRASLAREPTLVADHGAVGVAAVKAFTEIASVKVGFVGRFMPSPLARAHVRCRSLEGAVEPDDRDVDDEEDNKGDRAG
jgi:hypothetical protein